MRKATHNGHCQICGSVQKLPASRLSKHGYTVKWGFFSGTCPGSDGKPFEVSTDLIERAIVNATQAREVALAQAASLRAMTGTTGYVLERVKGDIYADRRWQETEVSMRTLEHRPDISIPCYVLDGKRKDLHMTGTPETIAAELRNSYARTFDERAADLQRYIDWQRERVASWQPGELQPIAPESGPRVTIGTTVRVNGREGTVTAIRDERVRGYGRAMPHAVITKADGKTFSVPVRSIRTILPATAKL